MSALWQEARAPDGRTYYYNTQTKATQWTKPADMMAPLERAIAGQPWREYATPEGRKYWSHIETKQSVWDMPESFKAAVDSLQSLPSIPAAPQFVAGGTSNFNSLILQSSGALSNDYNSADRATPASDGANNSSRATAFSNALGEKNDTQYSSYAEAEAAFFRLLKKNNVGADSTWEQAMKAIIKEAPYRAIKDPKDRKAAFEKYTAEIRMQDLEKQKDRMSKLRQDFTTMLKSHPEIKYYTRWKTARNYIEGETIFRSTSDDNERRNLFEEYILELRKEEQEREASDRKQALDDLSNLFKSMNLEAYTRWSEAQGLISENEKFKSESKFQALSKLDILNTFETHIKYLERTLNENRQKQKQMKMRKERKSREAYVALLEEMQAEGKIRSGTKWKEIHPLLKVDERYMNMLGQPGSTPLDLFWDKVEEIEREIRSKKNVVMDVLDEKKFQVSPKTTLDDFIHVLRADSRTSSLTNDEYAAVFDKIHEKSVKRSEEDRHHADRQQRRRVDALRSAIKHLEPPVSVNDSWAQVRARLAKMDEFKQLDSEDLRQSAFDKVIRRLKEKQDDDREPERKERKGSRGVERVDKGDRDRERDRERERERLKSPRSHDGRERHRGERERDKERDRNGHRPPHRTPEPDAYEAERRRAAGERERQHQRTGTGFPTGRSERGGERERDRDRERDRERFERERDRDGHWERDIDREREREARHSVSVYERERREREEERERQFRARDRDDISTGPPRRRARPLSPGDDIELARRDSKRSRHDRGSFERLPLERPPTRDEHFDKPTPKELGKAVNLNYGEPADTNGDVASEEGEIPE